MPIFQKIKKYNYKKILHDYNVTHGKILKPVNRRGPIKIPTSLTCPCCGTPHAYIYDNNNKGQFLFKVCSSTFNYNQLIVSTCTNLLYDYMLYGNIIFITSIRTRFQWRCTIQRASSASSFFIAS